MSAAYKSHKQGRTGPSGIRACPEGPRPWAAEKKEKKGRRPPIFFFFLIFFSLEETNVCMSLNSLFRNSLEHWENAVLDP
jgi:hypothetical protein